MELTTKTLCIFIAVIAVISAQEEFIHPYPLLFRDDLRGLSLPTEMSVNSRTGEVTLGNRIISGGRRGGFGSHYGRDYNVITALPGGRRLCARDSHKQYGPYPCS